MKALVRLIVIAAVVAGLASTASAALVAGVIPVGAPNEFIPDLTAGPTIGGYYGGQLYLIAGGPVNITVEWYGGEAGYNNQFLWGGPTSGDPNPFVHPGGDTTPSQGGPAVDADFTALGVSPGLLPFTFLVNGNPGETVVNGSNPDNSGVAANFFVSFDLTQVAAGGPTSGQSVWIFFDDGGAANDDNHDDMAIKLSITGGEFTAVPEPGSMFLVGSGLAAMWMRRRRS
jgi:hypothetical protein